MKKRYMCKRCATSDYPEYQCVLLIPSDDIKDPAMCPYRIMKKAEWELVDEKE